MTDNTHFNNKLIPVLVRLKSLGITRASIEYSGEGDSGNIFDPVYEPQELKASVSIDDSNVLNNFTEGLLGSGWEIDDGSDGWVTFDLVKDVILHSHCDRYTQYDESLEGWNFKGEEVENPKEYLSTESRQEVVSQLDLPQSLCRVIHLVNSTETDRALLRFWVENPEVQTITFTGRYEYDDMGGYVRDVSVSEITFTSDEAKQILIKRLDTLENFDESDPDWDDLLFDGCLPFIEQVIWNEVQTRPEDPKGELVKMIAEIKEAAYTMSLEINK
jgi:hypothetical protein